MAAETLAMTKLVVADLEAAKAFYSAVCGLKEAQRISGGEGDKAMTEIIMAGGASGGTGLVLYTYHRGPKPPTGECVLVFSTDDIEGFERRVCDAGGRTTTEITALPEHGLKYALFEDNEGHIVEAIQRT